MRLTLTLALLLVLVPLFSADAASPTGRYGWWTAVSDVVGDDASCGAGMVKHELYLREIGTGNPVTVDSAVFVAGSQASGTIASQASGTGPTIGTICFDPATQFLGVDIVGGTGYYDFHATVVHSDPTSVPRGKLMRTTVWVTPTSATIPEYIQTSPVNTIVNTNPNYSINLTSFPTTYGATGLSAIKLFVYDWNTGATVVNTNVPMSGGTGIKTVPAQVLPDGLYTWEFYISLNGTHNSGRFTSRNELMTGLGRYNGPFMLDRIAPAFPAQPAHLPTTPTSADTVTIIGSVTDALSGVNEMKVYVDGSLAKTCTFASVNTAECSSSAGPYAASTTHPYFVVATDAAGNSATSSTMSFSIPGLPDLTMANVGPAAGATYTNPSAIAFTGLLTNSTAVTWPTEDVWADVEIDWGQGANCAAATVEYHTTAAASGMPWRSLSLGGHSVNANLLASTSQLRNGSHCYRMVADRDNLVTESNDSNNTGTPWRKFDISGLPECSDGIDNDYDTKVDYPADPGCSSLSDTVEQEVPVLNVTSGPVTLNSGTLTQGQSVTFASDVMNTGGITTPGFTDRFTYQWGGLWYPLGGDIPVMGLSGGPGTARTDTSESLTLSNSGTLNIKHCVNEPSSFTESTTEDNCVTQAFTVAASNPNCSATTYGYCELPDTPYGNNVTKACTDAPGNCDYTCGSGGLWTTNANTCAGPAITTFKICDQGGVNCVNAGFTKNVNPGTPLEIIWASDNTTSCSAVLGSGFSTSASSPTTAGTDAITSNTTPNSSDVYRIACQYNTGTAIQSSAIVVTNVIEPILSTTQKTVNQGETVTINWDTNNGDETLCTLEGGSLSTATLSNGTGGSETGSANQTITGRTTFTLTCGALSNVLTVEVVPTGWES